MQATVNHVPNLSKLWGGLAHEVKITHRGKHEFFYVYTGEGIPALSVYEALRHLAPDSDEWDTYEGFILGSGYDSPDSLGPDAARLYYDYLRDNTERLFKLLGASSYEKFMKAYNP